MLMLKSLGRWLDANYLEKKKIQEGMLGKNCQAHVTVLRTCSMSLGGVYVRHLFIRLYVIGATNDGVRRGPIEKQISF